jgi:SAM-dependent methyltransferase
MKISFLRPRNLNYYIKKHSLDTDKGISGYLLNYEKYFSKIRRKKRKILELGINKGGSLLLWHHYFPQGDIVGLDINKVELPTMERLFVYQGEQQDPEVIENICKIHGSFDIIIDDASHMGNLTAESFKLLFDKHLLSGGVYVIEDWGTGYWETWPDGKSFSGHHVVDNNFKSHESGMVGFSKQLIDCLAHLDIEKDEKTFSVLTKNIFSIEFLPGQIFITKK